MDEKEKGRWQVKRTNMCEEIEVAKAESNLAQKKEVRK